MEELRSYSPTWQIEIRKFFATSTNRWLFMFTIIAISASPWLTLRKFDLKFEEYSWWYLDNSILNFIIYSSAYRLSWILLIVIPLFYHMLFSMEHRWFLRKNNRLFLQILGTKAFLYVLATFLLMALSWISTFLLYHYYCAKKMVTPEPENWTNIVQALTNLEIRLVLVFPTMVILFITFSKKWSYILLTGLLILSAFSLLELPYQFHYNIHYPQFNREWLHSSLTWTALLSSGLLIYYRYFTSRTYVFP